MMAHATPLEIPELLHLIVSQIDAPRDVVNMACTSKSFTDVCLRSLWREPGFDGSPLASMVQLFPDDIAKTLNEAKNPDYGAPPASFARFDYYAQFIRSLNLWYHGHEAYIARAITRNRPGVWIFPSLVDLHLGASGEDLESVPAYLSPTLRSLLLNHWDGNNGREIQANAELKNTLVRVCNLPVLENLDMADTLYSPFEDDPDILQGFARLADQLLDFRAQSFITVPVIFDVASCSTKLQSVFLNLTSNPAYVSLPNIVVALRDRFPALDSIGLYCTMEQAVLVFSGMQRPLPHINLKIGGAIEAGHLHDFLVSIFVWTSDLLSLRISSAANLHCEAEPPIRLSEILAPLQACGKLQILEIGLGFQGEQMLDDKEIEKLFRGWPDLKVCTIVNDAEGDLLAYEDEQTSFGLSLTSLISAVTLCPKLRVLALPFLDTSTIPVVDDRHKSTEPFDLQLPSSHIHNDAEIQAFLAFLRPSAVITVGGCDHFPARSFHL